MTYEKVWANNEKLNPSEKKKLEKDGLEIFNDIPYYAENGFESIPKEEWDAFKWAGLYLQRPKEAGYFMMRVNIPSGIITNAQAEVLASIAEDYGRDVLDITTRQAIQFHWLEIGQIPDIFKRLARVGLSSAGHAVILRVISQEIHLLELMRMNYLIQHRLLKKYTITSNIMKSFLIYHVNSKCLLVLTFIIQQMQRLTVWRLHLLRKK